MLSAIIQFITCHKNISIHSRINKQICWCTDDQKAQTPLKKTADKECELGKGKLAAFIASTISNINQPEQLVLFHFSAILPQ